VLPFLEQARAGLRRTVERGFSGALIAPAGTGKTALLRRLLSELPEARFQVRTVKVCDLGKRDLCREIARTLGLPPVGTYPGLVHKLQDRFEHESTHDGLRPVLVLDEAQDLRPEVLSMLRVLTSFQLDSRLVLSVVLSGQTPLRKLLEADDQLAVTRRLACTVTLRTLTREETADYVGHRLRIAGTTSSPFDQGALEALYDISHGNLRAIDALALESLSLAAGAKQQAVGSGHVAKARGHLWP
jgi:type II secretory pathway predicted ATPase ExeA